MNDTAPMTPMTPMTFAAFEADARAFGFDEVLVRDWPASTVIATHTHPFAAKALVVAGQMWLTAHGSTRHMHPGDTFELAAGVPHDERYGAEGATYWVARRG